MSCPHCGARNAPNAPWCTQCLSPLGAAPDPAPDPVPPPVRAPTPTPGGDDDAGGRGFRSTADGVEWRCPSCGTWNVLDRPACASCGQQLATTVVGSSRDDVAATIGRARRWLWGAALVGGLLLVAGVVLLAVFLGSGPAG